MGQTKINRIRGMHDILPEDMRWHRHVTETARSTAQLYGFEHMATPIVEFAEVFKRSLGLTSDVVNKEMYDLTDERSQNLVLRPENTAAIARAFINNDLHESLPARLFYSGPMFRYERPQKGRQRQFHQIGVETLGTNNSPMADVDTIACGYQVLKELGLASRVTLQINTLGDSESRQKYQEALVSYLKEYKKDLSEYSQKRLKKNPLRILDSKNEQDKKIIASAPLLEDYLNQCSIDWFNNIKEALKILEIDYKINNYLVRGLDYYCHTVFEFVTDDLGAQGTVLAGGRYDGLVKALGGGDIDGVGWAAGVERLAAMLLDESNSKILETDAPQLSLIPIGSEPESCIYNLVYFLRQKNIRTHYLYKGSVKKRMQHANKSQAEFALIIGDDELSQKACILKDLESGTQFTLNSLSDIPDGLEKIDWLSGLQEALKDFYRL